MREIQVGGIDFSLTGTGVALSDGSAFLIGKRGITTMQPHERVPAIRELAAQIFGRVADMDLVVAEMFTFAGKNSGGVGERGHLYHLTLGLLVDAGVPIAEAPTTSLKMYATGKGVADKGAMVDAVARRWPRFVTRGDENLCDAAVAAALGRDWAGQPLAPVPAKHRAAITNTVKKKGKPPRPAIIWPDTFPPFALTA